MIVSRSVNIAFRFTMLALVILLVGKVNAAHAASFAVNSTIDDVDATPGDGVCATSTGVCTLRAAIQEANALDGPDTIDLGAGTYTLTIGWGGEDAAATGDLDITDDLTLTGAGTMNTIIDGGQVDRVFHVIGSVTVEIAGVTIQNGLADSDSGAGVYNSGGVVTLTDSTLRNNWAWSSSGGAIYNSGGELTLIRSTVAYNGTTSLGLCGSIYTGGPGGGIYNGGGTVKLVDSTIEKNSAGCGHDGGGIYNAGGSVTLINTTVSYNVADDGGGISGAATLINCTVSENKARGKPWDLIPSPGCGGGIYHSAPSTVEMANTIVANNTEGTPWFGDRPGDCCRGVTSLGHNLDSDGSCNLDPTIGDLPNTNPLLDELKDNGGPTQTHALLEDSPAIDAGSCSGYTTDQRGEPRPIDVPDIPNVDDSCDIGAYELNPIYRVNTADDLDDDTCDHLHCSLREAINQTNASAIYDTIQFDSSLAGQTITLVDGQLPAIVDALTVDGIAAPGLTISGDNKFRVFHTKADVTLKALTITGGCCPTEAEVGGGILNGHNLTLDGVTVLENEANVGGGIFNDSGGTVVLLSSRVIKNKAYAIKVGDLPPQGGGIYTNKGEVTLIDSSVSGNQVIGGGTIPEPGGDGGGIFNSESTVTLINSVVSSNNASRHGGGIHNTIDGMLELTDGCVVNFNTAGRVDNIDSGGDGGGIYNVWRSIVKLTNSRLIGNTAVESGSIGGHGGGIYNEGGTMELGDSTVLDNNATQGTGIRNEGEVELTNSTVRDNHAESADGGISNKFSGQLWLSSSTISGNESGMCGGGIFSDEGTVTVINSTVSGNSTEGDGGGICNGSGGTATLTSSTISGNHAGPGGGGIYNRSGHGQVYLTHSTVSGNDAKKGGGIYNRSEYGQVELTHSTISKNSADDGGGIYNFYYAAWFKLTSTIVANNSPGKDCSGHWFESNGYNLDSDGTCGLDTTKHDLPNTNPVISYLKDNGGPTLTHGLFEQSPAIDHIPRGVNGCGDAPLDVDQRGEDRPADGNEDGTAACDIGAFELQEGETAIHLLSFTAEASADHVTLTWETGTELDNAGFNLWRSEAADGPYTKINDALIPAEGDAVSGASYTYTDTDVVKGVTYYYKLEDVDIHGVSTFHGPVSATPSPIRHIYLPLILK
jgi:CSLREA domain-containing protein